MKIGEILQRNGVLSERDLAQALAMQAEVGGLIGQALIRLGAVTEEALLEGLREQLGLQIFNPLEEAVEPADIRRAADRLGLDAYWLVANRICIWRPEAPLDDAQADMISVLSPNPLDLALGEVLDGAAAAADPPARYRFLLGSNALIDTQVELVREALGLANERAEADDDGFADSARLRELAEEAPVIEFVNNLFAGALKEGASDIHIEPFERTFQVRYRIDGVLHLRQTLPRSRFDAAASRIKLLSHMDIGERRLPQDGRQTIRFAGHDIDLRVSSLPGTWGESVVMRLLEKEAELPDLKGLGLTGRSATVLDQLLREPNGVFLVTGPTGSGKSTTLYRSLEQINDGLRKIITIEDPVEYDVAGVTQIQVKSEIGYTFARGLRAILRQDPDVILVGEIRDGETASIAVQAALTGHLVLSTLHTNSALAAIPRLVDIGLEPFLIGAALRGVAAQRLVRRVCPHCSTPDESGEGERFLREVRDQDADIEAWIDGEARWRTPQGCEKCAYTGYRGRLALVEIAAVDEPLRQGILEEAPQARLREMARKSGFLTLMEDGLLKARAGLTTVSEVMRVCGAETV